MRDPSFWWREPGFMAALLRPAAALYGGIAAAKLWRKGARAKIPVICVGNLTAGGAGKTPTAIAIAKLLLDAGARPYFLTRGYGGALKGPIRVDPERHRASDVGDEPLLLARVAPAIVAHDRRAGAKAAAAAGASVIVMDDGFQNASVRKDLALIVIDGRRGIGNGRVIPAGPLRAPLEAQLAKASAVLVIGKSENTAEFIDTIQARGLAVLHGRLTPDRDAAWALAGKNVLAFAGIGDPEKFFITVKAAGIAARMRLSFPDHHRYTEAEAKDILAHADREQLIPLTTEKDFARMKGEPALADLAARVKTLPVTLVVEDEDAWGRMVLDVVAGKHP